MSVCTRSVGTRKVFETPSTTTAGTALGAAVIALNGTGMTAGIVSPLWGVRTFAASVRHPSRTVRARFPVTPQRFLTIAYVALAALTVIVLTGAAVRLTDSGLGCPDWPRCYGRAVPPLSFHSVVEYGNRVFSARIGFVAIGAFVAALLRTPRRRDLIWISALLPIGCLGQAMLGAFTVRHHLAPGFVMAHFGLSMLILIAAVALVLRARATSPASGPVARPRHRLARAPRSPCSAA